MRAVVRPGFRIEGAARVPGDKSISHRWLMLGATAEGTSRIRGLPRALDVRSTARCLSLISGIRGDTLARWAGNPRANPEDHGFTWDSNSGENANTDLVVEGEGWAGLQAPTGPLDCENSGTTMRLLMGALAGTAFETTLIGDLALSQRPMERVAEPLRLLGANISTHSGHAPVGVAGRPLKGAAINLDTPSSQVKSAVLLAGLVASGMTNVTQLPGPRDHTERALVALGAPLATDGDTVTVSEFQHKGFEADVPGDPSSAVFLLAASAITGGVLEITGVGLNPTRTGFLEVLEGMGVAARSELDAAGSASMRLGEDAGRMLLEPGTSIRPVTVSAAEIAGVIDDVVMLAVLSAFAPEGAESRFEGAAELRVKESDRLAGIANGIVGLGGRAEIDADTLTVRGGGLAGGTADADRDHRLAMALTVGALGARSESHINGIEWADVSFPGFAPALRALGASIEEG